MNEDGVEQPAQSATLSRRRGARPSRAKRSAWWIALWTVVALVVLGSGFVAVALYTDRPAFCRSCHEMTPYYDAWASGKHNDVACIACHVAPGLKARFAHKFVALAEVRSHFMGDTKFPRPAPPNVPPDRCTNCHPSVPAITKSGFTHAQHAEKATCSGCHAGHLVTSAALQAAGIYQPGRAPTVPLGAIAVVGAGSADVPGHIDIFCSSCHDLAKTGCAKCHTPKHQPKGDCVLCHQADLGWRFRHPGTASDCGPCHRPPANHFAGSCVACHPNVGVSFAFSHPSAGEHSWQGFPCAKCHPNGSATVYCTCHPGGRPPRD